MTLKKYREAMGLTQKDVADRVGLSANRYAQIERGDVALPAIEIRRQICEVLGIRHVDFLVCAGAHVKVVSERLGHKDPAFTMRIYQHLTPDLQRSAADALDSSIFGEDEDEGKASGG